MSDYKKVKSWQDKIGNTLTISNLGNHKIQFYLNDKTIVLPYTDFWNMILEMGLEEA